MITFEDFQKVEIKIGTVLSAEKVEGSEKLLKFVGELRRNCAKSSCFWNRQDFYCAAKTHRQAINLPLSPIWNQDQ